MKKQKECEDKIIDLPDNKFIITNLDLPEDELIDMYYNGMYNDLAKDNSC